MEAAALIGPHVGVLRNCLSKSLDNAQSTQSSAAKRGIVCDFWFTGICLYTSFAYDSIVLHKQKSPLHIL